MSKIKCNKIRGKTREELNKDLDELRTELASLRVSKVSGGPPAKLAKIKVIRKNIARILTVYNQTVKSKLRDAYSKQKLKPLDLRPKKTRAYRRRLSPYDAARKTERQRKRDLHFPMKKFSLKA